MGRSTEAGRRVLGKGELLVRCSALTPVLLPVSDQARRARTSFSARYHTVS